MSGSPIEELQRVLCETRSTQGLSKAAHSRLADVSILKSFKRGEFLWEAEDPGEFSALIVSGFVEINRPIGRGRETCMGIFGPGDTIGLSAVTKRIAYPAHARVLSPGTRVAKQYIRTVLAKSDDVGHEIHLWTREMLMLHEQILRDKIDFLSAGSVSERLWEALKHLGRRFGISSGRDQMEIPIGLTRGQLARLIDARVETVIRMMRNWQSKGLIEWSAESKANGANGKSGEKKLILRPASLERHILETLDREDEV